MAKKNGSDMSNYDVVVALTKARSVNQYVVSAYTIAGKSLNAEEAKAFLIYLAESVFDPGDERDIVLVSWRLLQGFESAGTIKECHRLFSELSAYNGSPGGLDHKETTLYRKIAEYYTNVPDKDEFLAEAIRAKLPNKKGKVQL